MANPEYLLKDKTASKIVKLKKILEKTKIIEIQSSLKKKP